MGAEILKRFPSVSTRRQRATRTDRFFHTDDACARALRLVSLCYCVQKVIGVVACSSGGEVKNTTSEETNRIDSFLILISSVSIRRSFREGRARWMKF